MNSFNHYAYGSVGEFLYRVIAGIDTDPEQVGYRKLVIRPRPGGGLTHASAAVMTPYGRAESSWRIDGSEHFRLNVTVPHNTTAAVTLPDGAQHVVGSGRYDFTCTLSH